MDLNQAVAIVGVACRFPGGANLDEFWKTLEEGKCLMEDIRKDRWSIDAFYDPNKDAAGKTYSKRAAFIDNWDEWDNTFFEVSEAEAERMDPQQKIALECVYKAIENAGISIDDLWGSNTSVYMGQMNNDKAGLSERDLSEVSSYTSTGIARSMLSNRVSYTYNLQGPSMTLDTACSAGLVAVHQGIRSILSGECCVSICGGISLILSPSPFVGLSKARMSSETGTCHAFSDKADGYARGEGCGVLVLKSVKQAKEDGDYIWGFIASAVNQDGHTVTPITAPSVTMQEKLLRELYGKIQLEPQVVQYVEAHGTGTRAGDPVEVGSLGRVIGAAHDKKDPCWIGSVKTNIGHTESAAGIAGTIKVLLMMRHGKIVPSLHFDVPNPNIDWNSSNLAVPTSVMPWQVNPQGLRIAGINSFGFGGTNAHAILVQEEHFPKTSGLGDKGNHDLNIVTISGKCQNALTQSMADLLAAIKSGQIQKNVLSLSYTSTARRRHFRFRRAFTVHDTLELAAQLEKRAEMPTHTSFSKDKSIVFVFGGMGTHWSGMGMQLIQCERVFREKMEEIDSIIQQCEGWGLLSAIQTGSDLSDPTVGQPAIFAIQVSLATLWRSWGVLPRAVIGLSVGEIAAAHIAGKLNLSDAVKVICTRGKLLSQVTGGAMLVIGNMDVSAVKLYISQFGGTVEIGAQNSPITCTISGDEKQIDAIHNELNSLKATENPRLFLRKLPVNIAFHSHFIDSIVQPLGEQLAQLSEAHLENSTDIISSVSGKKASTGDFTTAHYWQKNARQGAVFSQGLQTLTKMVKNPIFIEISPKPALGRNITETLNGQPPLIVPSMKENEESRTIIKSLAAIYASGVNIAWKSFWGNVKAEISTFPRYQYQRKRLYNETKSVTKWRLGQNGTDCHSTREHDTGFLVPEGEGWLCLINKETTPFVYDHRRTGKPLVPAAMYAEIGLSACIATLQNKTHLKNSTTNVSLVNALHINQEDAESKIHVLADQQPEMPCNYLRFFIKGGSMLLAEGDVQFLQEEDTGDIFDIEAIKVRCAEYFEAEHLYDLLETHKYTYGKRMRAVEEGVKNKTECLTKIVLPKDVHHERRGVIIHPAILDSCFQLVALLISQDARKSLAVPVALHGLKILGDPMNAKWIYMKVIFKTKSQSEFSAHILDINGHELAKASRIIIKSIDEVLLQNPSELRYMQGWILTKRDAKKDQTNDYIDESAKNTNICHIYANSELNRDVTTSLTGQGACVTPIACRNITSDIEKCFIEVSPKAILFSMAIRPQAATQFTEPDLAVSEECCWCLMNILKYCLKRKYILPVFVLTKHVYLRQDQAPWAQLHDLPQLNANSSLIGSALWGLARTAVREGLRVICIDMIRCNLEEINKVSSLVMSDTMPYPEWVLADYYSYRNEFLPYMGPPAHNHRVIPMRHDDVVRIVSKTSHGSITVQQDVVELKQEDTHGHVKVVSARLHDNSWFPSYWNDNPHDACTINDEAQTILALDYTAKMLNPDRQGEFFGCQPIPLVEVAHVDSRTLVPVSLLPSDQPMLSLWLVSWDVLHKHAAGINHIRVHNLANWHILEYCIKSVAQALTFSVEEDTSVIVPLAIVFACKNMAPKALHSILQTSEKAIVITSDANLRVVCGSLMDEGHFRNVTFYNHVDLFVPHQLVELVPNFKAWLLKCPLPKIPLQCKVIKPKPNELREGFVINGIKNQGNNIVMELPQRDISTIPRITYQTQTLFRSNGCYILVGANKGQGLAFLKQMAALGAGVLIALSRTPPTKAVFEEYELMSKENNVQIHWVQTDATDKNSLIEAFLTIDRLRGKCPIRGIFQGAVVLADALVQNLTYEQFVYAYRVKVHGTFYLHSLTQDMELDYFVLHSSITAILGNIGQTAYGAANEFMNCFASYRRSIGLPGQSINWSPLKYGVIQWNTAAKRHLMSVGIVPLENDEVWYCMKHALLGDLTYVTYGKFDLEKLITKGHQEAFGISSRLIFLATTASLKRNDPIDSQVMSINLSKMASEAQASKSKSQCYIEDIISEQLSISSQELAGSHALPLADLGFNSMDAVYVASKIQQDFNIHIDTDGNSSIDSMTTDLWSKFEGLQTESTDAKPFGPFEQRILQLVQNSAMYRRHMSSFLTLEITNCFLSPDSLVDMMKGIIEKLPHLRTSTRINHEGRVTLIRRSVDSINVQAASVTTISLAKMRNHLIFLANDLNVSTETPFKVQVHNSYDNHQSMFLGMVFHRVVDDCHTIHQILSLLINAMQRKPQPLPLYMVKDDAYRIQEIVAERYSEYFWRHVLPDMYEIVKMPQCFFHSSDNSEKFDGSMFKVLLDGRSYESALDASMTAEVSLNQYVLALFQLYIHFCSDAKVVIVEMTIDMREILPKDFRDYSGNLDNELLVVSTIDPSINCQTRLLQAQVFEQCKHIQKCVQHGLFPNQSMLDMIQFPGSNSGKSVQFAFEYRQGHETCDATELMDMDVRVVEIIPSSVGKQTLKLYVVENKSAKQLELYLLSGPGYFSEYGVKAFATGFQAFLNNCSLSMQRPLKEFSVAVEKEHGGVLTVTTDTI